MGGVFRTLAVRFHRPPDDSPRPPWPRRAFSLLRRQKKTIGFAALIIGLLGWTAWPHLSAQLAGLLAERRGHYVEWRHYISEDLRGWAPLPKDAAVWKTPTSVFINYREEDGPPQDPETLTEALNRVERMPRVEHVDVSYAAVSVEDARRFVAVHESVLLGFGNCDFAPGALEVVVAHGGYTWVNLLDCTLPPGELAGFSGEKGPASLNLTGSSGVGGQFEAAGDWSALWRLNATGTTLHDADLTAVADGDVRALLAAAEELRELRLSNTAVTDAAFDELPERTSLFILELADTEASDATVRRLAQSCPNLERLDLSNTAVTDAALPHLARLTSLTHLSLAGTRVTAAAADPSLPWPERFGLILSKELVPEKDRPWMSHPLSDRGGTVLYIPAGEP